MSATNLPEVRLDSRYPSRSSSDRAFCMVFGFTPADNASSLTDGTLLPGFRLPFAISILNRSIICMYMGVSLLKFHSIISPVFVLLYYLINTIIHVRLFVNYKLISYKNVRYEVEM